ncbi:MAG TPA: MarR family transcriptional regulator [Caulobacteraceae bacterium]
MTATRLTDEDYAALGAFREALRNFLSFSEAGALELGLTSQHHQALLAIRVHTGPEPMTVGRLAASLQIKSHSAVGLVSRLQERGLVTRSTSDEDRRRAILTITPKAEALLETISRNNLAKLQGSAEVFARLLDTVQSLEARGAWKGD